MNVKNPMDIGPSGIFPDRPESRLFRSQRRRVRAHPGHSLCRHRNLAARGGPASRRSSETGPIFEPWPRESRWSRFCSEERNGSISSKSWAERRSPPVSSPEAAAKAAGGPGKDSSRKIIGVGESSGKAGEKGKRKKDRNERRGGASRKCRRNEYGPPGRQFTRA